MARENPVYFRTNYQTDSGDEKLLYGDKQNEEGGYIYLSEEAHSLLHEQMERFSEEYDEEINEAAYLHWALQQMNKDI